MPPFSIDANADLVHCHRDGGVPTPALGVCLGDALDSPEFRRGFGFVLFRRRGGPGLSADLIGGVAALIRWFAPRIAPCRWAVVVAGEGDFPAVRVMSLMTDGSGVTIAPFTILPHAEQWARGSSRS